MEFSGFGKGAQFCVSCSFFSWGRNQALPTRGWEHGYLEATEKEVLKEVLPLRAVRLKNVIRVASFTLV